MKAHIPMEIRMQPKRLAAIFFALGLALLWVGQVRSAPEQAPPSTALIPDAAEAGGIAVSPRELSLIHI